MKKDMWRWLERGISIAAVVAMFIAWRTDHARWETKLQTLINNDEKRTEYWNRQNEINGRILTWMQLSAGQPRPAQEDQ
jgi:anti-sigma-K factor RskA